MSKKSGHYVFKAFPRTLGRASNTVGQLVPVGTGRRYEPNGERECARRMRQIFVGMLKVSA